MQCVAWQTLICETLGPLHLTCQRMQGNCTGRVPAEFDPPNTLKPRTCMLMFSRRAIELTERRTRLWLAQLYLQLRRPRGQSGFQSLVKVDAAQGNVWITNTTFMGDGGVAQGLSVGGGSEVFLKRAPCLLVYACGAGLLCCAHLNGTLSGRSRHAAAGRCGVAPRQCSCMLRCRARLLACTARGLCR